MRLAAINKNIFEPGESVIIKVILEPKRKPIINRIIKLNLPEDLPQGRYSVTVGSAEDYRDLLQGIQPYRYQAYAAEDIISILGERLSVPRDRLYAVMPIEKPGLAIENIPLPRLPGSKAMQLNSKNRKIDTDKFDELISNNVEVPYIVFGNRMFDIIVQK